MTPLPSPSTATASRSWTLEDLADLIDELPHLMMTDKVITSRVGSSLEPFGSALDHQRGADGDGKAVFEPRAFYDLCSPYVH